MLGWLSWRVARASRSKRDRRSASATNEAGSTFTATSRARRASRARYTSPIPPAPRGPRISYGPSRVPGVRGTFASAHRGQEVAGALLDPVEAGGLEVGGGEQGVGVAE